MTTEGELIERVRAMRRAIPNRSKRVIQLSEAWGYLTPEDQALVTDPKRTTWPHHVAKVVRLIDALTDEEWDQWRKALGADHLADSSWAKLKRRLLRKGRAK